MTLREFVSDLELIATKSKISKDQRLERLHLQYLTHKWRARGVRETYQRQGYVDPVWIQDLGIRRLTPVDSAEEISVACSGLTLGKVTLPRVLSLPDDKGVVRVSGTSQQKTYYPISIERFFDLDQTSPRAKFNYYMRSGDHFYLSPLIDKAHFRLVLDNPMEGDFFDNTIQHEIQEDLTYQVLDGTIIYDGNTYVDGSTFVGGLAKVWTGGGKVYFNEKRRPLNLDDPYPMSFQIAEFVSTMILTRELNIEASKIADIKNDNVDQLILSQQQANGG